jgi:hypothetical protein
MHNNYLDQFEKTNFQVLSSTNSAAKKRNKNTTKSYNQNGQLFDNNNDTSYMNYSANMGQLTNKSVVIDSANYNSNNVSLVKNYDNSFGPLQSSKAGGGAKRPQSTQKITGNIQKEVKKK